MIASEPTRTTSSSPILDFKGVPITKGAIVGMSSQEGNWSKYQGLVIEPNSDIEDDAYIVAVFFDREVSSTRFWLQSQGKEMRADEWDSKHAKECPEILLVSEIWKKCPRIIFFRPAELVVEGYWKSKHLVKRYLGVVWVSNEVKVPLVPNAHACWIEGCDNSATHRTFCNIWGTAYELYTCLACFQKFNGLRADDLPATKKPLPKAEVVTA